MTKNDISRRDPERCVTPSAGIILMESEEKSAVTADNRPVCFGDEAKFVAYMDDAGDNSECGRCPSENECGEFILLKCSRELIF